MCFFENNFTEQKERRGPGPPSLHRITNLPHIHPDMLVISRWPFVLAWVGIVRNPLSLFSFISCLMFFGSRFILKISFKIFLWNLMEMNDNGWFRFCEWETGAIFHPMNPSGRSVSAGPESRIKRTAHSTPTAPTAVRNSPTKAHAPRQGTGHQPNTNHFRIVGLYSRNECAVVGDFYNLK